MNQKELVILGLIFAAFVAIVAIDWRKAFNIQGTMEAAPLVPASRPSAVVGPASAAANVPLTRIVLPANLGGYTSTERNAAGETPDMFACGMGCS